MEKRDKKYKGYKITEVIIIIIITAIVSALTTGIILCNNYRTDNGITYDQLLQDNNIKEFLNVYSQVLGGYYENVDTKKAIDSAISGMMSYLDDKYTTYMNSNTTNSLTEELSGKYEGIGISINNEGKVVEVFDDSPAKKVGIEPNDRIIGVNGTDISEQNAAQISSLIQESQNKNVDIKIKRGEETKEFNIKLEVLISPSIAISEFQSGNKNIGYIYISKFTATLKEQVKKALNKFDNIDSLIIDVRDNNGGYLSSATDTTSLFLEKNKVIYYLEAKDETKEYKDETDDYTSYPIVVLINNSSASAAEILAAALKDSYGAILIGNTSYGKGKVQETYRLDDGSMVKYTSAKWLRPNGNCIDGEGIIPDYMIDLEIDDNKKEIKDTQLEEAIKVISNM